MYTLYISKWTCSSHIDHGICFRKDTVKHPPENALYDMTTSLSVFQQ